MYGKREIARRLANELQLTPGAAADEVDRVVAGILKKLRKGQDARLPGVGILHPVLNKPKKPKKPAPKGNP